MIDFQRERYKSFFLNRKQNPKSGTSKKENRPNEKEKGQGKLLFENEKSDVVAHHQKVLVMGYVQLV